MPALILGVTYHSLFSAMSYLDTVHAGKLVAFSQFNSPLFIYLLTKKQGFILVARSQTLTCFPLHTLKRKKHVSNSVVTIHFIF
jgi:tetrahydromethanopterin S-methyltransferase subunit E